jgi:hypothetical protein
LSTEALIERARSQGVELWVEGNRLRFRASPGALTPAMRSEIEARKVEVVALLGARAFRPRVDDDTWAAMRRVAPHLGEVAEVGTVRGVLWGLTPRGAILDSGVLRTVDFKTIRFTTEPGGKANEREDQTS